MSAAEERGPRKNVQNKSANQPNQNVANRGKALKGNAQALGDNNNTQNNKSAESPALSVPRDEHVPMNGFNSREVDDFLRKGNDAKATAYKPDTAAPANAKTQSPWGQKAGTMANGRDFWLELRKQVTALQKTGGVQQGG